MLQARLIAMHNGQTYLACETGWAHAVAAFELRGFAHKGEVRNPALRAELQGKPVFEGLVGPMWDGNAIRYETHEVYEYMSR